MIRRILVCVLPVLALTGCAEPPEETPEAPTPADTVRMAEARFDPAAFDTVTWESDQAALDRGGLVFRVSCTKCHGDAGDGDGNLVVQGDTIRPPSFRGADWRFATDPMGLRRQIFVGTEQGMPHWGLEGLKYRDVDAVARYILEDLRGSGGG